MRRQTVLLSLVWSTSLVGPAWPEPPGLPAGLYEIEVRLELPHIEDSNARKTVRLCLAPADPNGVFGLSVLSDNNPLSTCPLANIRQDGNALTFDIVCKGVNQAKAAGTFLLAGETFRGRIAMQMGGKNMTMTEVQTGRRIGPCGAKEAPPT